MALEITKVICDTVIYLAWMGAGLWLAAVLFMAWVKRR